MSKVGTKSSALSIHHSTLSLKGGDDEETCRFDCGASTHLGHRHRRHRLLRGDLGQGKDAADAPGTGRRRARALSSYRHAKPEGPQAAAAGILFLCWL